MIFARFRSEADDLAAERERVRKKAPHLALVEHVPVPPKSPEKDFYVWRDVGDLFGGME